MKWISVDDRLPEEDDYYIINLDGLVMEAGFDSKNKTWHDYTVTVYHKVKHWMPLPEPPQ